MAATIPPLADETLSELFAGSLADVPQPSAIVSGEPQQRVDKGEDQIDTLVADALKNMTLEERDNVYYEQHGVADEVQEDPETVSQSLEQMEHYLQKLKGKGGGSAFRLAESKFPDFVKDPKLRMQFLHAESFVPKKAAARMIRYFDFRKTLFEDEAFLGRKITLQDIKNNPQDLEALNKGFLQVLPCRDRAGRIVLVLFPNHRGDSPPECLVRNSMVFETTDLTSNLFSHYPAASNFLFRVAYLCTLTIVMTMLLAKEQLSSFIILATRKCPSSPSSSP